MERETGFEPRSVKIAARLLLRGPAPLYDPHEGGTPPSDPPVAVSIVSNLERETGFEPATLALARRPEGNMMECDGGR